MTDYQRKNMGGSEPRTLFEIREDMRALIGSTDAEEAHALADGLLIEAVRKMGSIIGGDPTLWPAEIEDLVRSYQRVRKWYA